MWGKGLEVHVTHGNLEWGGGLRMQLSSSAKSIQLKLSKNQDDVSLLHYIPFFMYTDIRKVSMKNSSIFSHAKMKEVWGYTQKKL